MQHLVQFSDDTIHIPSSMLWHESEDCLYITCVQQGKRNIFKSFLWNHTRPISCIHLEEMTTKFVNLSSVFSSLCYGKMNIDSSVTFIINSCNSLCSTKNIKQLSCTAVCVNASPV